MKYRLLRRLFHFGTIAPGALRPFLWISLGTDYGAVGSDATPRQFLNVTLFGRYLGRIYYERRTV